MQSATEDKDKSERGKKAISRKNRRAWMVSCLLSVFPFTAVLHHSVFCRPTCILNNFGDEYTLPVVGNWLTHDPSLFLAIGLSILIYHVGKRFVWVRRMANPIPLAFLPLTVWIWDIPFSGRWLCRHFHDGLFCIFPGHPLRTLYVYALSIGLYALFLILGYVRGFGKNRTRGGDISQVSSE